MQFIGEMIYTLDGLLDTTRKRHILGGILISISLLFGGMAMTIVTIKDDTTDKIDMKENDYE